MVLVNLCCRWKWLPKKDWPNNHSFKFGHSSDTKIVSQHYRQKTRKSICKLCGPMLSFRQLRFATSWLRENIEGTKIFSYGNNVSDDLSYPKTNLFHYLVRDDLWWMTVVTVNPFKKPFPASIHDYSYCHKDSCHGKWIYDWRKAKTKLWKDINRFLQHSFGCLWSWQLVITNALRNRAEAN